MSIGEHELRSRLAEAAGRAGPPRFTPEDLAARVRRVRRRRRNLVLAGAVVVVAAVTPAVAVPLTGARRGGGPGAVSSPAAFGPGPSFTVTLNGQTHVVPSAGMPSGPPEFYVVAGERLAITVDVTVPAHPVVGALWLGINNGVLGAGADGLPLMNPVLVASTRAPLRPGTHRYFLHWTVPAGFGPGASRLLAAGWKSSGAEADEGSAEQGIAEFAAPPGVPFSATAVRSLRGIAVSAARGCDVPVPASVVAVRTTVGKASAALGESVASTGYAASQAVYLVVMTAHFPGHHAQMPPCAGAHGGHYLWVLVDAATLSTIETALRNAPPLAPLQSLGPVRDLTGSAG